MKIDENSVKINEIDDDDDDCGGDGGSSSILYLKTPDQPPLAATMLKLQFKLTKLNYNNNKVDKKQYSIKMKKN